MNQKSGDNIYSLLKLPIAIITVFLVLLLGKNMLGIQFGGVKKLKPTEVEFFEPTTVEENNAPKQTDKKNNIDNQEVVSENQKQNINISEDKSSNGTSSKKEADLENPKYPIESFKLTERVFDENGFGLEGVEVWCGNCLHKEKVVTDKNGMFSLRGKFKLKDRSIHSLEIWFKYKKQQKKLSPRYNYLDDLEIPKFKK